MNTNLTENSMTTAAGLLAKASHAFRESRFETAINAYLDVVKMVPNLWNSIGGALALVAAKYRRNRDSEYPEVLICALGTNSEPSVPCVELMRCYMDFTQVRALFRQEAKVGGGGDNVRYHYLYCEGEDDFMQGMVRHVAAHPVDVVHLIGVNPENVLLGLMYKLLWRCSVVVHSNQIDDTLFTQLSEGQSQVWNLPSGLNFETSAWRDWAYLVAHEFDGYTVDNSAARSRFLLGTVHTTGRDLALFVAQLQVEARPLASIAVSLGKLDKRLVGLSEKIVVAASEQVVASRPARSLVRASENILLAEQATIPEPAQTPLQAVLASELFDTLYYAHQRGRRYTREEAVRDYVVEGAERGIAPMIGFNYDDYRNLNPELASLSNLDCFLEYISAGRQLKRYFNFDILRADAREISAEFGRDLYGNYDDWRGTIQLRPEEHYLCCGWRTGRMPNTVFDSNFYLRGYEDARASAIPPFLHYLRNINGRIMCDREIPALVGPLEQTNAFDSDFYRMRYGKLIPNGMPEILHYACQYHTLDFDPNPFFSTEYYMTKYPDIAAGYVNPLVHYHFHGKHEGRIPCLEFEKLIKPGLKPFMQERPTILIVCHEASRSGAPILGLKLVDEYAVNMNVISWLGRDGPLYDAFSESSVAVVTGANDQCDAQFVARELQARYGVEIAVVNSVATNKIAAGLFNQKIAMVALIHEYADYMQSEVVHMLMIANRVVVPAQSVKDSANQASMKFLGGKTNTVAIKHQGRCAVPVGEDGHEYTRELILSKLKVPLDAPKPFIVLGCGFVQMRKGVDIFIQAAAHCKTLLQRPFRFVWVGGGYQPEKDFAYSVWLKSQVSRSGLDDELFFFEEASSLDPFFELADVFFLSSRLDPFPNVAIDAAYANVPTVAFRHATGFNDFIDQHPKLGTNVPFLDGEAAARAICSYEGKPRPALSGSEKSAVNHALEFGQYADFVLAECNAAIDHHDSIVAEARKIAETKLMDVDFFKSGHPFWGHRAPVEYVYTSMWARNIPAVKSSIGFNDLKMQAEFGHSSTSITPLFEAYKRGLPLQSHHLVVPNPFVQSGERPFNCGKVGVHIHAHYVSTLPELLARFKVIENSVEFVVTTDSDEKAATIAQMLGQLSTVTSAKVVVVPNRGRDVGPFIMTMKSHLADCEVVGHFHLKGTKQLDQTVVRQWQDFLYDSLLGKEGEIAQQLLAYVGGHPETGLLFQEDPALPHWTENFDLAQQLYTQLGIAGDLPPALEYPTGNMFWCRTDALGPLLAPQWEWDDFPSEPVPYDGTQLHAIERLTPFVCEAAGYRWETVYNVTARRYRN